MNIATSHEVPDDLLAAIDYCYDQGWTDGLPVVPPEASRVEAMMQMEGRPPETVIAHHPATGLELTIQAAAVNAVMAGCLPDYFPVVIAAFEAMNKEPLAALHLAPPWDLSTRQPREHVMPRITVGFQCAM